MTTAAVGVDVGGVLIARGGDAAEDDTSFFGDRFLETPAAPGAFEALRALGDAYGGAVYVVSKCGPRTEHRTRLWLAEHDLEGRTGVSPWNVWFVRHRRDKRDVARELGLTAFVDDRLEILGSLAEVSTRVLFDPVAEEVAGHAQHLPSVIEAAGWTEALPPLLAAAA